MTDSTTTSRFTGKVAIITGTSDRGIGGATAQRLAEEGASVVMVSRSNPERLLRRLEKINAPYLHIGADITKPEDICRIVQSCLDKFGKPDILVNNAGIEVSQRLVDSSDEDWRKLLEVNLSGCIALTREAIPHMKTPGAAIVNVASALGLAGCVGFSVYSASKAGMIGFTQSLAWEIAGQGIRINCVAPGLVLTPMAKKHVDKLTTDVWKQVEACHPLGIGRAADVASAIAFLASEDARWITGITLPLGYAHQFALPIMGE